MNNSYFGDIKDYRKYSLIRFLSGKGQINTAICWLLTEDYRKPNTNKHKYLEYPGKWQRYDPALYEHLQKYIIQKGLQDISVIEESTILPNCRFYKDPVPDDNETRKDYFSKFFKSVEDADLVFFDPDNGLAKDLVSQGNKKSSKHIYLDEIEAAFKLRHSLLLFQYFPPYLTRIGHQIYIDNLINRFTGINEIKSIFSYCTPNVVFLLFPQSQHRISFIENNTKISQSWGDKIGIKEHDLLRVTK